MSDGAKSGIGQIAADINEVVVEPVKDEVGKALEQGVQSVVQGPQAIDPAKQQQKRAEEAKGKQHALNVIEWYRKIDEEQKKVRQEKQQQLQQQKQEEAGKKQEQQSKENQKQQRRQELTAVQVAERKTEVKRGVGG